MKTAMNKKINRVIAKILNKLEFACPRCNEVYNYEDHTNHMQKCSHSMVDYPRCPMPNCESAKRFIFSTEATL
jgi:phage FluMu protein Com